MRRLGLTLTAAVALAACGGGEAAAPLAISLDEAIYGDSSAGGEMLALPPENASTLSLRRGASAAAAATGEPDIECVGVISGVFGNIVVPPGQRCIVTNSIVHGNIKALEDAVLGVFSSRVDGNIVGDKSDVLQLRNNTVGGNIDIVEVGPHPTLLEVGLCGNYLPNGSIKVIKSRGGVGISPFAFCVPSAVNIVERGNLQIEDNRLDVPGKRLFAVQNFVGQNLQAYKNRGPFEKIIMRNTAGEVVQCFDNDPPIVGGPNIAPKREGQCF